MRRLERLQGVNHITQIALHDGHQFVKGEVDAVIGQAALREVVGADAVAAVARSHQAFARGGFLGLTGDALGFLPFALRCSGEAETVVAAGADGELIVTCTQETPLFNEVAGKQPNAADITFVNIRENAGWSKDAIAAGPKIAALIAASPTIIVYLLLSSLFHRGLLAGSVKG
mgnify:CR=1 FL=1